MNEAYNKWLKSIDKIKLFHDNYLPHTCFYSGYLIGKKEVFDDILKCLDFDGVYTFDKQNLMELRTKHLTNNSKKEQKESEKQ